MTQLSGTELHVLLLFAAHFVGDFAFQSAWMAMEKRKNLEVLAYHVFTYSTPFVVLAVFPDVSVTLMGLVLNAVLHFIVDYCKGREWVKTIWQDQMLHAFCIGLLFLAGLL